MNGAPTGSSLEDSLPTKLATVPLVLDEDAVGDAENENPGEIEEEFVRHRVNAARTLFHHPRGDDDTLNSTCTIYDSDIIYHIIHGRRYCGNYYIPNDETEQRRMQMLHDVYHALLSNRLTTVPLSCPSKILDIGTGTGDWAMAMGDEYPEAEIIGTDIAKIQPSAVPLNVFFEIDDAEEEGGWTWPDNEFDFVHLRHMAGAFRSWSHIYRESLKCLKPGGWIEVLDFDSHEKTLLSFFDKDSDVVTWLSAVNKCAEMSGRPRGTAHLQPEVLAAAGFVNISVTEKVIPMGVWPENKEEQSLGKHFLVTQLWGIQGLCLRPLTEQLGYEVEEVEKLCISVENIVKAVSMDPKSKGLGFTVRIITARKPGGAGMEECNGESLRTTNRTGANVNGTSTTHEPGGVEPMRG